MHRNLDHRGIDWRSEAGARQYVRRVRSVVRPARVAPGFLDFSMHQGQPRPLASETFSNFWNSTPTWLNSAFRAGFPGLALQSLSAPVPCGSMQVSGTLAVGRPVPLTTDNGEGLGIPPHHRDRRPLRSRIKDRSHTGAVGGRL